MNLKEAIKALSALGLSLRKRDGEYRVAPMGVSPEEAERKAYYTDDLKDAVDTGRAMKSRNPRKPTWEEQALAHRKKYESFEERCMRPSRKRHVRNPRRNSKACKIVRFKYRAGRRHRLAGFSAPARKSGLAKWLLPVAGLAAAYFLFIRKG